MESQGLSRLVNEHEVLTKTTKGAYSHAIVDAGGHDLIASNWAEVCSIDNTRVLYCHKLTRRACGCTTCAVLAQPALCPYLLIAKYSR